MQYTVGGAMSTESETVRYAVEVVAGLFPGGAPEPEFTKRWYVTSEEWARTAKDENDTSHDVFNPESPWGQAVTYAATLVNPARVNWVRIDWVWM